MYYYVSQWRDDGSWEQLNHELRVEVRLSVGKAAEPSAAILDSQSVKVTKVSDARGYDAGKKVNGITRHVLGDTLCLVLNVTVLTADIQDRDGARTLLEKVNGQFPRLQKIWVDGGYARALSDWVKLWCGWLLEIVKRTDKAKGFEVLPHRWIVERTFAWLNRLRRLSKDYERLSTSGERKSLLGRNASPTWPKPKPYWKPAPTNGMRPKKPPTMPKCAREAKAREHQRPPRGRPPMPPEHDARDADQYNFTDPQSRITVRPA